MCVTTALARMMRALCLMPCLNTLITTRMRVYASLTAMRSRVYFKMRETKSSSRTRLETCLTAVVATWRMLTSYYLMWLVSLYSFRMGSVTFLEVLTKTSVLKMHFATSVQQLMLVFRCAKTVVVSSVTKTVLPCCCFRMYLNSSLKELKRFWSYTRRVPIDTSRSVKNFCVSACDYTYSSNPVRSCYLRLCFSSSLKRILRYGYHRVRVPNSFSSFLRTCFLIIFVTVSLTSLMSSWCFRVGAVACDSFMRTGLVIGLVAFVGNVSARHVRASATALVGLARACLLLASATPSLTTCCCLCLFCVAVVIVVLFVLLLLLLLVLLLPLLLLLLLLLVLVLQLLLLKLVLLLLMLLLLSLLMLLLLWQLV
nr:uncharacterized protein LOC123772384 isoform X3 [Procambarus clarkii]